MEGPDATVTGGATEHARDAVLVARAEALAEHLLEDAARRRTRRERTQGRWP
jgi:hypothetical protein